MRSKKPSLGGLVYRGPPIAMVAAIAIGLVLAMCGSAHALGAKDLPLGSSPRYHPDDILNMWPRDFYVYTGAALPAEWALEASLSVDFMNGKMWGTMTSQVWQHTDEHTLFAYQLDNTGDEHVPPPIPCEMRTGDIMMGFAPGLEFLDVGILDYNGDVNFDDGDVLKMEHYSLDPGGQEQFAFSFEAENSDGGFTEEWLLPGETSSWFYIETNAEAWQRGLAGIQNGGSSVSNIPVLVPAPVPEPVTLLGMLLGIGTLAGYVRRRRTG